MNRKKVELVRTYDCMAHEVFISHSSLDKPVADTVCAALENIAIRCWIAPRDVQPGRSFAGEITRAIQRSKVMVLIFSAHSNTSEQILREVQLAANSHLHIFQFRIENVLPNEDLEYYLSTPHWLDALTPPLESNIQRLGTSAKALLEMAVEESAKSAVTPIASSVDSRTDTSHQSSVATAKDPTAQVKSTQTTQSQPAIPPPASISAKLPPKTKRAIWVATVTTVFLFSTAIVYFHGFRPAPSRRAPPLAAPAAPTRPLPQQQASPANLPPSADILFSDSFHRAGAAQWDIGQGDMAFGGRARFFYLPIFGVTRPDRRSYPRKRAQGKKHEVANSHLMRMRIFSRRLVAVLRSGKPYQSNYNLTLQSVA